MKVYILHTDQCLATCTILVLLVIEFNFSYCINFQKAGGRGLYLYGWEIPASNACTGAYFSKNIRLPVSFGTTAVGLKSVRELFACLQVTKSCLLKTLYQTISLVADCLAVIKSSPVF